jgi:hypothetical protein
MAIGNPISSQNNYKVQRFSATAGQTLFTITDGYELGKIAVFRNGVRLNENIDFTAADASTVTLNVSCQANDEVVFEILDTFSVISIDDRVGIESGGTLIGRSSTLNFTGAGNTVTLKGDGSIDIAISGGARGGGPDKVFQENQRVVTTNYQLTSGYSAVSVGPVSVSAGVTVTIPGSERWVIL